MRMRSTFMLFLAALCLWAAPLAAAQTKGPLKLHLSRDFGYGGFGGDIQGLFTISATGPSDLQRVTFLIDGQPMGAEVMAPFKLQFHTDSFPPGEHTLSAMGTTTGGDELRSDEIHAQFLSAAEANKATTGVILPVVGVVAVILVALVAVTLLTSRRHRSTPLGQPRRYGVSGGAICPKCGRPFPLSVLGLNLGLSRLTPCPYCRKWSTVRRRRLEELRAAEAAELERAEGQVQIPGADQEDALRRALDDSRYQDS